MLPTFFLQRMRDIELHCDSYKGWSLVPSIPTGHDPSKPVYYYAYAIWVAHRQAGAVHTASTALVPRGTTGEERCAGRNWASAVLGGPHGRGAAEQRAAQHQRPQVSRGNASTHSCTPGLETNSNQSTPDDKSAAERS